METRIIEKESTYYPQVKTGIFTWQTLTRWWGNFGTLEINGHKVQMYRDCRIAPTSFDGGCSKKEDAQEIVDMLNKQGYLYTKQGITPTFEDGFMHFNTELNK